MGRTIPSFIQLVESEKLNWSAFKKLLPTEKDKQVFDGLFENVNSSISYLGNASKSRWKIDLRLLCFRRIRCSKNHRSSK